MRGSDLEKAQAGLTRLNTDLRRPVPSGYDYAGSRYRRMDQVGTLRADGEQLIASGHVTEGQEILNRCREIEEGLAGYRSGF